MCVSISAYFPDCLSEHTCICRCFVVGAYVKLMLCVWVYVSVRVYVCGGVYVSVRVCVCGGGGGGMTLGRWLLQQ